MLDIFEISPIDEDDYCTIIFGLLREYIYNIMEMMESPDF